MARSWAVPADLYDRRAVLSLNHRAFRLYATLWSNSKRTWSGLYPYDVNDMNAAARSLTERKTVSLAGMPGGRKMRVGR